MNFNEALEKMKMGKIVKDAYGWLWRMETIVTMIGGKKEDEDIVFYRGMVRHSEDDQHCWQKRSSIRFEVITGNWTVFEEKIKEK